MAFAYLHWQKVPLFLPNAWDYASGVVLSKAGFAALGTTSLGIAAAAGKRDADGQTRDETIALALQLVALPTPLTVDLESGFSDDPDEVADLAEELADAGVVGINLEDGRPDGTLEAIEAQRAKIIAVKARVPTLFVNARVDTFWLGSSDHPEVFAETVRRAAAYISAEADGIFVPAASDVVTIRRLRVHVHAPLNVLYMPGKHTFGELSASGVARVSTGSLLFREALRSAVQTARDACTHSVADLPDRPTYAQMQEVGR